MRRLLGSTKEDVEVVDSFDRLNEILAHVDTLLGEFQDDAEEYFKKFKMEYPSGSPSDPLSDEYAKFQSALYRRIANKDYHVSSETTSFDVEQKAVCPCPYDGGSTAIVGRHFILIGHLLQHLDLRQGAKVLEFGSGWGNTTLALATMGFDVTAIDIEPNFVNLIRRRCERQGVSVNAVVGDFSKIHSLQESYDAIIFFECFHHCSDHLGLLKGCYDRLKDDGRLVLSAEPISPDFDVPWGLRLDGQSLWAIRRFGWLELGYREDYFVPLMRALGWDIEKFTLPTFEWAPTFVARKGRNISLDRTYSPDKLLTRVGILRVDGALAASGSKGWLCYGPYTRLEPGRYRARFGVTMSAGSRGTIEIDACHDSGRRILSKSRFKAREIAASDISFIDLAFDLDRYVEDLEVRMHVPKGTDLAIRELRIDYRMMEIP